MAERKNPLAKANAAKKTRADKASKLTEAIVASTGQTPLNYLLEVMRNPKLAADMRMDAAKAAAPYVHPKLATVTHEGGDKPLQVTCTVYVPKKQAPRDD